MTSHNQSVKHIDGIEPETLRISRMTRLTLHFTDIHIARNVSTVASHGNSRVFPLPTFTASNLHVHATLERFKDECRHRLAFVYSQIKKSPDRNWSFAIIPLILIVIVLDILAGREGLLRKIRRYFLRRLRHCGPYLDFQVGGNDIRVDNIPQQKVVERAETIAGYMSKSCHRKVYSVVNVLCVFLLKYTRKFAKK